MKRHMQPTEANRQMTERYRLALDIALNERMPEPPAAWDAARAAWKRRATVAGMPTTPAWYGAAKPKGGVSK